MYDIGRSGAALSRRDASLGAVAALVLMAVGIRKTVAETNELNQRFDYLSGNGNSNCSAEFMESIATMPSVARLQGSCCSPMDRHRYVEQIKALEKYSAIKEIPPDPYDIAAGVAQKVMPYYELALTPDEE